MKLTRVSACIISLSMTLTLLACSSEKTSVSTDSLTTGTMTTTASLTDEINALQLENTRLKDEVARLSVKITGLETEIEQISQSTVIDLVRYDLQAILEEMNSDDVELELFTAEIETVQINNINGLRYFVFRVNRHRPGWGTEVTIGEDAEGYPVKAEIQGKIRLIFNYQSYSDDPESLVQRLEGQTGTFNFLMIDHDVVYIAEPSGP